MLGEMRLFSPFLLGRDVVVGGMICASGDVAAQHLKEEEKFDAERTVVVASYGSVAAIVYHPWYRFLAYALPSAIWAKTALEVFFVVPFFEIPAFMCWTGYFGRKQTLAEAVDQLERDFGAAFAYGIVVWGPTSIVTFKYVPTRWQLLAFYTVGAVWDCGLSSLSFDHASHHLERR